MRAPAARLVAALGAILGWTALAVQFFLTLRLIAAQGGTVLDAAWRYLGYFTILTNIFAAAVLTRAVLWRGSARLEFCAVTAMLLVGVTYSLLLRNVWNPQGWQKLADMALHDVLPLFMLLFWLLRPHGLLRGRDVAAALLLPLGYCAYALVRGATSGWYAYHFVDVTKLGASQVALNCVVISAAFAMVAIALRWLDGKLP